MPSASSDSIPQERTKHVTAEIKMSLRNHMQTMNRILCSCELFPVCDSSLKQCGKNFVLFGIKGKLEEANWTMCSSSSESNWHKSRSLRVEGTVMAIYK